MSHVKVYNKKQNAHHILTEKAANNLPNNGNYIIGEKCDQFGRTNNFNNFLTTKNNEQKSTIPIGGKEQRDESNKGNESGTEITGGEKGTGKQSTRKKKPASIISSIGGSKTVDTDDDDDDE